MECIKNFKLSKVSNTINRIDSNIIIYYILNNKWAWLKKGQLVKTFSNIKIAYVNSTGSPLQTLPTTEDAAAIIATVQQQRNTLPASFEQEEDNASKKKDFFATFKRRGRAG